VRFTRRFSVPVHRGLLAAGLAALAVFATACGSSDDSSSTTGSSSSGSSKLTDVTIAYAAPVADHMIPTVTQAAGIFKKNGINAKIQFLQGSQIAPALLGNKIQFATLAAPTLEVADLSGSNLKTVAQWENVFDAALVAKPEYKTMQDLDGKSITTSAPATFSDMIADIAMQKYGIKMQKVPLGHLSNSISAFESGQVDSISDLSPWQVPDIQKKVQGANMLVDFREITGVPGLQLVGNGDWIKDNPETTQKVVDSINEGIQYFKTHKAESVKAIEDETESSHEEAVASYDSVVKSLSPTIVPSLDAEKKVLQLLEPSYPEAKGFDASKFIDTTFAQKAAGGQ
jgi:NitT/TauT family transport system substrate-binding protein